MTDITPKGVIERYRHAKDKRGVWESHWQKAIPKPTGMAFLFFYVRVTGKLLSRQPLLPDDVQDFGRRRRDVGAGAVDG